MLGFFPAGLLTTSVRVQWFVVEVQPRTSKQRPTMRVNFLSGGRPWAPPQSAVTSHMYGGPNGAPMKGMAWVMGHGNMAAWHHGTGHGASWHHGMAWHHGMCHDEIG